MLLVLSMLIPDLNRDNRPGEDFFDAVVGEEHAAFFPDFKESLYSIESKLPAWGRSSLAFFGSNEPSIALSACFAIFDISSMLAELLLISTLLSTSSRSTTSLDPYSTPFTIISG